MARQFANVLIASDTFASWVNRTNDLIQLAKTGAVTVAANTTGDVTVGNGHVNGILSVKTLVANTTLRGGSLSSPNTLNIGSNVAITGVANATVGFNVGANVSVNTSSLRIGNSSVNTVIVATGIDTDGTLSVAGNIVANGTTFVVDTTNNRASVNSAVVANKALSVTGNTQVIGEMYINGSLAIKTADIVANTKTITATNAITVIDSFPIADAGVCKYLISVRNSTNQKHAIEMLVMHDGTDVYSTRYAELFNTSLGTFTTTINATAVAVNFTPAATGTFEAATLRIQVD